MNERLRKEIEKYHLKRAFEPEYFWSLGTAEHFYNLALEDIKKEVTRRMLEDYNDDDDSEINEIAQGVCAGIIYFIEEQMK